MFLATSLVSTAIITYEDVSAAAIASESTKLSVEPPAVNVDPGGSFSVNITVTDVKDLWGWQLVLSFEPNVLNVTGWKSYPPFTIEQPSLQRPNLIAVSYNMEYGTPPGGGFSGTTAILQVDFIVNELGASSLHISDTLLVNPGGAAITHEIIDGDFANVSFKVSVEPIESTGFVGSTFPINITVAEVGEMWSYYFNLTYNKKVLTVTNVTSFNPFSTRWVSEINNSLGYVCMNYSLSIDASTGFETFEPVPIAQIEFRTSVAGRSTLVLKEANVGDMQGKLFRAKTKSGSFSNFHDIAVTDISASPTKLLIGTPVTFNVTVKNQGDFPETFNVTLSYANAIIETKTVAFLDKGNTTNLIYQWDTSGFSRGLYNFNARSILNGDTDSLNDQSKAVIIILGESQMERATLLYALAAGTAIFTVTSAGIYSRKIKKGYQQKFSVK